MQNNDIIISLNVNAAEIKLLANELEETNNSEMVLFLEKLLRTVEKTTENIGESITAINVANPFSHVNKGAEN